jgi:hypothetical protein
MQFSTRPWVKPGSVNKPVQNCPSWRTSFAFPLSTPEARRDLVVGGTLLFLLPVGWILNLGHRLDVVHRIYHQKHPIFRGFSPWLGCFTRGLKAVTAIVIYLSASIVLAIAAYRIMPWLWWPAGVAFVLGVYILPGGMTYNAAFDDIRYLYRPDKALARAIDGGRGYLHAWLIALVAISLSMLGLLFMGVGVFYTSIWAWMVVGHAFSVSLSLRDREAV